jgi:hypothetical protein
MKFKKFLVLLTLLSSFILASCAQIPYEYSWFIYDCYDLSGSNAVYIYIKFRPDGTLEFKDIEGNIHKGTFVFDDDNENYNLTININNQAIYGNVWNPIMGYPSLEFTFNDRKYYFIDDNNIYYEYNFPIIEEIKDLYGDKYDRLIDKTDDDIINNPDTLTKFEYYYDVYLNMKKYELIENKHLNYANIDNVNGIYYVIETTWENAKPIDLWEKTFYYDVLNKDTTVITELREGPCVVTYTDTILEVYYFDNYIG